MLSFVLLIGLAAAFTTQLVRALPGIRGSAARGTRPWSCDLCMSLWTAALWAGLIAYLRGCLIPLDALAFAGGGGISLLALSWLPAPKVPPEHA